VSNRFSGAPAGMKEAAIDGAIGLLAHLGKAFQAVGLARALFGDAV